ncbi:retrovirus-related pol polyprotein from transposon TNT 1-94 [Tanacetum coccineum]
MAHMGFCDKHDMLAFLQKPAGSDEFHQIVDFLAGSHIRYALTTNSTIYVSLIEQFWQTVTVKTVNTGEQKIIVIVDGHKFTITEANVRRQLQLADEDGLWKGHYKAGEEGQAFGRQAEVYQSKEEGKDAQSVQDQSTSSFEADLSLLSAAKILAEASTEKIKTYKKRRTSTDSSKVSSVEGIAKGIFSTTKDIQERTNLEVAQELQRQFDQERQATDDIDWKTIVEQVQERQSGSMIRYHTLKKKPVTVAQATKNMKIYLKNIYTTEVNATLVNSLPRKWLSMNQTQRANNAIKNDTLAALYGKYNYEEGLIDQIYESETSRFTLQGSTSKALISNSTIQESDSDVKEDQKSSSDFLDYLNVEFHERALLANKRRFFKRSGRVGSQRKPMDKSNETCFACGKLGHFQKDGPSIKTSTPPNTSANKSYNKPKFHTNSTPQNNPNVNKNQKEYKVKYKGLKAKIVVLTHRIDAMSNGKSEKGLVVESFDWDEESASSDKEGVITVKAFMAIADEELSVGKTDARLGQWVDITMRKASRKVTLDQLLSEQVPRNIVRALGGRGKRKEKNSLKEINFKKSDVSSSKTRPEIPSNFESEGNTQAPLFSLSKLVGAEPSGITKCLSFPVTKQTIDKVVKGLKEQIKTHSETSPPTSQLGSSRSAKGKSKIWVAQRTLAKLNAQPSEGSSRKDPVIPKPYIPCKYCGFNDHHSDECEYYPGCELRGSIAHETSDCDYLKRSVWYLDSGCSRHMTGVKQCLHRYSKESGPKVVFGDISLGDTEGYGSVICNGITFTRVAYANGLKHNLISISQLYVYVIDMSSYNEESNACFFAKASPSVNWLWHKRLSHLKFKNINKLAKQNLVAGLPSLTFSKDKTCSACEKRKRHKASFKTKRSFSINKCLRLLHMDLFGPKKSDAAECIISLIRRMENLNEMKVKELRSDNGTEFRNHQLEEFCDEKGARTMLNNANLPKQFWGKAVNTACYTHNRSIIVKRHGKTAYDVFRGKSPDISYFHVFRVFNIRRQEMEETYHVTFSEDDDAISQSSTEGSNNNKHLPYIPAYDPLSSNNLNIPENTSLIDSHCPKDSVSPDEQDDLNDVIALTELDHLGSADNLEPAKV